MNNPKSLIPSLTQFPNFTTLMRAFCVSLCSVKFCSTPPCSSAPPCSSRVEFCFAPPCSSARAEDLKPLSLPLFFALWWLLFSAFWVRRCSPHLAVGFVLARIAICSSLLAFEASDFWSSRFQFSRRLLLSAASWILAGY
ncbi:hypothetical protein S83_007637 [Arachis hypogaea]